MLQQTKSGKAFLTLITTCGWLALLLQFYLIIINRTATVAETIIRYFSFFTILTNILVAVCCTYLLIKPNSFSGKFFSKPATLTAITVYIVIVGIVYNVILRFLWQPQGLQKIVDELLHSVIPALCVIYWFVFAPKSNLKWKNALSWLLYPFAYIIYTIIRGELSGFYPYPFIDVNKTGYNKALTNTAWLCIAFFVISLLFIAIGKIINNKSIQSYSR